MPLGLRERLAEMSEDGVDFAGLVDELDTYKDKLPPRQYDELWLFCWALAKRHAVALKSTSNGEGWPDVSHP